MRISLTPTDSEPWDDDEQKAARQCANPLTYFVAAVVFIVVLLTALALAVGYVSRWLGHRKA